jgi:hypothetical protein
LICVVARHNLDLVWCVVHAKPSPQRSSLEEKPPESLPRPLRVRENWTSELFGDYNPETTLIRVWMRTAVKKELTSYGTFLSTPCHEFCHHLDFQRFGFRDSWHTRGFYERTAALYHYVRDTAPKKLVWAPVSGGRWRIEWPRTNRSGRP